MAMLSGTLCACTNKAASEGGKTGEDTSEVNNVQISTSSTPELTSDTLTDSATKEENTSNVTDESSSTISKESVPETTSSAVESNTYKNIDEVPPIVIEGDPVPFTVSGDTQGYDFDVKFSRAIIKSREELLSLYEENGFESSLYGFSLFKNAKAKYDSDYFNENALILLYSRVGSSSKQHRFDCLVKKDKKLYAGILEWIPGEKNNGTVSSNTDISAVCYVIEVKKSDIQGINDIEVNIEYNPYIS